MSALLCTACFPPFNQTWLCWIALTPLIAAIWFSPRNSKRPWLRDLLLGYVAGVVFFTAVFSWLGSLGTLFENFWLHGLSLLLSLYLALSFAFWTYVVGLIRPTNFVSSGRNLLAAFLAASAWVAHEWTRGWLFGGFGWNGLGVALSGHWSLIQIAEFTGVTGLSFVIAFANVIALTTPIRLFLEARTHQMRPHWDVNFTMLAIIGLLVLGWRVAQSAHPSKPLRVAAVQAGIPQREKFDRQSTAKIFDEFTRLSGIALQTKPPPDLLIWPEGSMPGPVLEDDQTYRFVMDISASTKTDLLLGTDDQEEDHVYNAALLVSGSGRNVQIYRKLHLVPFGEYIPLRHSFPLFAAVAGHWVPGDFGFGKDYTVFRLTNDDVQAAPLICFEDTIGELTRKFVLQGANLLVNITNDGWFLHSAGSKQHLANAVFRCVETRRPMVRAANTGVTCFINEFGRVTQVLQDDTGSTFTQGVLTGDVNVPQDRQLTFYTRHGELFAKLCTGVTLIALVVTAVRRRVR
ncbi:MAG: apolipoprotein N-acyltransferase [Verrucomicrobiota bacterium]|nr:apolipoprotein N-acyltransferase [Verrucomicrobiota bacterium]